MRFNDALAQGRGKHAHAAPQIGPDDVAVLQYTGGTTGVSKGAVLLHRNLVANVLQSEAWYQPALKKIPAGEQVVTRLRAAALSHLRLQHEHDAGDAHGRLQHPDPEPARPAGACSRSCRSDTFHSFPAVNTLFNAMANHPDFGTRRLEQPEDLGRRRHGGAERRRQALAREDRLPDLRGLRPVGDLAVGHLQPGRQHRLHRHHRPAAAQHRDRSCSTTTATKCRWAQPGEIAIKGPQVMAGYWQRPDETAKVMTADGYFRTGDIGVVDERGYFKIVDRKKDMILVCGFNVYPNEVEDVVTQMPGVLECAAVGVADEKTGEAVKLVIVKKDPALTEAEVRAYCEANLTGYKRPKVVEFRTELPKTPVGKILRRELRDKK